MMKQKMKMTSMFEKAQVNEMITYFTATHRATDAQPVGHRQGGAGQQQVAAAGQRRVGHHERVGGQKRAPENSGGMQRVRRDTGVRPGSATHDGDKKSLQAVGEPNPPTCT